MISVEIHSVGQPDEIEISFDADGLESLLAQLNFIAEGKIDHAHLMAESWGGNHLDEKPLNSGATAVKHVRLTLV